jgi:hypothetical protein
VISRINRKIGANTVAIVKGHCNDIKDVLERSNRMLDLLNDYFTREMGEEETQQIERCEKEETISINALCKAVSGVNLTPLAKEEVKVKTEDGKLLIRMERVEGNVHFSGQMCSIYTDGENEFLVYPDVAVIFKSSGTTFSQRQERMSDAVKNGFPPCEDKGEGKQTTEHFDCEGCREGMPHICKFPQKWGNDMDGLTLQEMKICQEVLKRIQSKSIQQDV